MYNLVSGTADLLHAMDRYEPTPLPNVSNEKIIHHNQLFLSRLDDTLNGAGVFIKQADGFWS